MCIQRRWQIHGWSNSPIWVFPKIGGKPPKWMVKIMENPIKMDDLGVPLFLETPICFLHSTGHKRLICSSLPMKLMRCLWHLERKRGEMDQGIESISWLFGIGQVDLHQFVIEMMK